VEAELMRMTVLEAHQAAVVVAILAEEGVESPPCWRVEVKSRWKWCWLRRSAGRLHSRAGLGSFT